MKRRPTHPDVRANRPFRAGHARAWALLLVLILSACCPPAARAQEAPDTPEPEAVPERFSVLDDELIASTEGGAVVWRVPLPAAGGPVGEPRLGESLWLPRGLYLLELDPASGDVQGRWILPAPGTEVRTLEPLGVEVRHPHGATETVRPEAAEPPTDPPNDEVVRFGAEPASFGWLRAEAEALGPEAAAWDPTNPWLLLARADAAAEAGDAEAAEEARAAAAEAVAALPFFEAAALALALNDRGDAERADAIMDAALRDFARRGYDPRLLTDPALHDAYGFPLRAVQRALEAEDPVAVERWAPWLWRTASTATPETVAALHRAAGLLDANGESDAAALWRERATTLQDGNLGGVLDAAALSLARYGWRGVAATLAAALLLYLTLWTKYLKPQAFYRQQRRERGEPLSPWSRALAIRHFGTMEKLVLFLLLVAAGLLAALTGWGQRAADLPPAWRSGTLASAPATAALEDLSGGPEASFVRGYAALERGDREAAERLLRQAGDHPDALNDLGALLQDDALYQRALRFAPRHPEARFNLGRRSNPSPFHEVYGAERPLLAVPSPATLGLARGGDWRDTLATAVTRPWSALADARPERVPTWSWWLLIGLYLLLLVATLAAMLWPRPRVSRSAPRSWAYHVLAVLIPGTGQADELYGVLLLLPWSVLGLDLLVRAAGGPSPFGLGLGLQIGALAAIYLINWVTFGIEYGSYRQRMRRLRQERPELARSLGLPPAPVARDTEA